MLEIKSLYYTSKTKRTNMEQNFPQNQPVNIQPPPVPNIPQKRFSPKKIIVFSAIAVILAIIVALAIFVITKISRNDPKDEQITLTYWTAWEDPKVLEPLIKEYETQNPNVKIKLEVQDIKSLGDYIERLFTRIKNGGENAPDIYRIHTSWIPQLRSLLLPLPKETVKSLEIEEQYYTGVKKAISYSGAYYGVPLYTDNLALFVNRKLLEYVGKPIPTEWIEMLDTGSQLTTIDSNEKITQAGVAMGTYENIQHSSDIVSLLMIQSGVDLGNPVGERAEKVLEVYTAFAKFPKMWDRTLENSKLAFAKGNLAMYFGYSWDILGIRAVNPLLEYDIVPVPHIPKTNQTITSFWIEGVSSGTKHPDAAFKFLEFLGKKESLAKIFENASKVRGQSGIYPRRDLGETQKNDTLFGTFVNQAENSEPTIFAADTYDNAMVDKLNNYLKDAVNESLGNSSYKSATEKLKLGIDQVTSQYVK